MPGEAHLEVSTQQTEVCATSRLRWMRCDRRRRPARGGGRSGRRCPRAAYGYTEAVPMDPIRICDFASEGVTLTPATAADFDGRAQAILGGNVSPLLELKPYLAIVRNQNPRTVVAYTVSWTVTLRNGMSEDHHTQFKFPDAVAGTSNGLALLRGREIRTGEERVVGVGFEVWRSEEHTS